MRITVHDKLAKKRNILLRPRQPVIVTRKYFFIVRIKRNFRNYEELSQVTKIFSHTRETDLVITRNVIAISIQFLVITK